MSRLGRSVVSALPLAIAFVLTGCSEDTTTSGSSTVFGTTGTTVGTGVGPAGQAVLVRLGTDNLVASNPPNYEKLWVALVTDTNGNPVPGATVVFALRSGTPINPGGYFKGGYVRPGPAPAPQVWTQSVTAACANEDANFNDILDAGEDFNGNGLLDPPGVAGVNPTGISDATGFAKATVAYPKNYAGWAQFTLEARTGSSGTPATATFILVGLVTDFSDLNSAPPGAISPFGSSGNCADTL